MTVFLSLAWCLFPSSPSKQPVNLRNLGRVLVLGFAQNFERLWCYKHHQPSYRKRRACYGILFIEIPYFEINQSNIINPSPLLRFYRCTQQCLYYQLRNVELKFTFNTQIMNSFHNFRNNIYSRPTLESLVLVSTLLLIFENYSAPVKFSNILSIKGILSNFCV